MSTEYLWDLAINPDTWEEDCKDIMEERTIYYCSNCGGILGAKQTSMVRYGFKFVQIS